MAFLKPGGPMHPQPSEITPRALVENRRQAVQHLLHPPTSLAQWPDGDHDTRIVFITRDIDPAAIEASLDLLRQAQT